jgi:DNA invertase Pin-like site-specific DNA recombinase
MGRGHHSGSINEEERVMSYRPPQITDDHLRRSAAVYIRQSSSAQVRDNVGSALIQLDLVRVPRAWGWSESGIEIRDDRGSSADEPGSRAEFERLLRDMAGRLGLVVVSEFSRIGRNELDQAMFSLTARLYNVLLSVGTTVYDFRDPNSAYSASVLGFGAVREHRVRIGQGREARRRKAEHGLEPTSPPVGFVKTRNGPYAKTNDERVREVIQLVWDIFFQLRSGRGTVRYLRQRGIQIPVRVSGVGAPWRDATQDAVFGILKNPVYGGIYIYGKTKVIEEVDRAGRPRKRQVPAPPCDWIVREGLHIGYVTSAQFREGQEILASNRVARRRPPGGGRALLQGLLRCAVHQRTLNTTFDPRERQEDGTVVRRARYVCCPGAGTGSYQSCRSVQAKRLDPLVEAAVFERLKPATIDEINREFEEDLRQHEAIMRARDEELRRAERHAAELEREYLAIGAEHRHVKDRVRTLWEETRARVGELKLRAVLEPAMPPERLSDLEMEELRELVSDLPRLWRHPSVTPVQKKTVLRLLVDGIVLSFAENKLEVTIQWAAGGSDRVTALSAAGAATLAEERHRSGRPRAEIAAALTAAGAVPRPGDTGYSVRAARDLVQRIRRERGFVERAYRLIQERFLAADPYREIARKLNEAGIPHLLNIWNTGSVGRAVRRMQKSSVVGLPVLQRPTRMRDEVQRLAKERADAAEILSRLRATNCLTYHRQQPTLKTVQQFLRDLRPKPACPRPARTPTNPVIQGELSLFKEAPGAGSSGRGARYDPRPKARSATAGRFSPPARLEPKHRLQITAGQPDERSLDD